MTDTRSLLERHRAVLPNWIALYYDQPIELVSGEGRYVEDRDGNRYLDFFGGILTTSTGYNVPEVVEAIREQAGKMLHSSTLYLIESQVELAETLAGLSGIPDAKVFFTNSGTEANDTAMMLATAYRRSNQVLALRNSYHGRSYSAIATTGIRSWSPSSLSPVNVNFVHGGYRYRSPFGHLPDDQYIAACVDDLRDVLRVASSGDVACMIAEPIQGVGGFITPPDGMLGEMKKVLDESGILYISDEVQTAWGRTGEHFWGYQSHDTNGYRLVPDMITFAKGLGNGLAVGGVIARREIMDCIDAASISTFGGNPLATTGSLANLRYLLDHDLQNNARTTGERLRVRLEALAERTPAIGDVRGKGLMLAVELVEPGGKTPAPALAARWMEEARSEGLLIGKGGSFGNALRIAPPLTITHEEIDLGCDRLEKALARALDAVAASV